MDGELGRLLVVEVKLQIDGSEVGRPSQTTVPIGKTLEIGLIHGHIMGIYSGDFHNSHNRVDDWIKKTEIK